MLENIGVVFVLVCYLITSYLTRLFNFLFLCLCPRTESGVYSFLEGRYSIFSYVNIIIITGQELDPSLEPVLLKQVSVWVRGQFLKLERG
jgi:hypothetical protein